jgi:hypothetical protein
MALADQQPVGMQPLELRASRRRRPERWRAPASEGVRRQGEGAEDVDDDCEPRALRAPATKSAVWNSAGRHPLGTLQLTTRLASTGCSFMTTTLARLKKLKSVALAQV